MATLFVGILIPLSVSYILPMTPPIYESACVITQQGANYTSAMWKYDIQPEKKWWFDEPMESWAYFDMDIRNIEDDFDLSDCKGVSFYIQGSENADIEFNLFTHAFYKGTHDFYQYRRIIAIDTLWKKETIYFSNLIRAPWTYSGEPESPALKRVYAIGFAARTNENRIKNTIFIDEVELIYENGNRATISDFSVFNANINGKEGYWYSWWGINRTNRYQ